MNEILMRIPLPPCVHGFAHSRSCVTNSQVHVGQDFLLRLDIKDFFPSIQTERLSICMGRLVEKRLLEKEIAETVIEKCLFRGSLPQGAPTSPALSNLYMRDFDIEMMRMAKNKGFVYTRYADDLIFSGNGSLKMEVGLLIRFVEKRLGHLGLTLNKRKTKLMPYYQRQLVNGICVNSDRPSIPRVKREELFGRYRGFDFRELSEEELGYLAYAKSVDKHFVTKLLRVMVNAPIEENVNG